MNEPSPSEPSPPAPARPAGTRHRWHRLMTARDPAQEHRASTPLELLFDLCFVVAVSQAAAGLHHAVAGAHVVAGLSAYLVVFFSIWWAWMNFTWFASAYDTDDVPYRVLTVVQMAGVLVMAAGIPALFDRFDIRLIIVAYVIMRLPMVAQWLRAAREDPQRRRTCQTYALCLGVIQVLWVALIVVPPPANYVALVVLIAAEVSIPPWAESRGRPTTWHPEHIAERYGLLTLIVLGEVILGVTTAVGGALAESEVSATMVMLAAGGLLLVFGVWWTYFLGGDDAGLTRLRIALTWGYGHYLVFGAIAALGAGLEAAVEAVEHTAHAGPVVGAAAVAVPVAVFLVVLTQLRRLTWPKDRTNHPVVALTTLLLLACIALAVVDLGLAVLAMGVVLVGSLTTYLTLLARRAPSDAEPVAPARSPS